MSVVIPKHVEAQYNYANVGIINCNSNKISLKNPRIQCFEFKGKLVDGDLSSLPSEFSSPNLVVLHGVYFRTHLKFAKYLMSNKIPYVIIPHGSLTREAQNIKWFKKKVANYLFFNHMIKNSSSIQYLSEGERDRSLYPNLNSFVSYNGIEISPLNKNFDLDKAFTMIYIGRIDIYTKGLDLLIEACSLIKNEMENNNIKLEVYGPENKDSIKLRKIISEKGIEDLVQLYGPIYDEQKREKLLTSDVFIQTSRFEGQPMGVIEALSFGLPTILTRGTNLSHEVVLAQCGWDAGNDPNEIGNAIIRSYQEKKSLKAFSSNAFKLVKEKFEWEKVANETIKRYKNLVDN